MPVGSGDWANGISLCKIVRYLGGGGSHAAWEPQLSRWLPEQFLFRNSLRCGACGTFAMAHYDL